MYEIALLILDAGIASSGRYPAVMLVPSGGVIYFKLEPLMARIRTVKPEFWTHPIMGRATDSAKCMAIALLNCADDEGYFLADVMLIRSACRPFDDNSGTTTVLLQELSKLGWIIVRQNDQVGDIGCVVNFTSHQAINKPKESKLKRYFESGIDTVSIPDDYRTDTTGKGKERNREQGKEQVIEAGQNDVVPLKRSRPTPKKETLSDEDWIQSLINNPAYGHINVPVEFGKMAAWCQVKNKQPTRSRFLNWLNRIEKPIRGVAAQANHPKTFDQIRLENIKNAMKGAMNDEAGLAGIQFIDG